MTTTSFFCTNTWYYSFLILVHWLSGSGTVASRFWYRDFLVLVLWFSGFGTCTFLFWCCNFENMLLLFWILTTNSKLNNLNYSSNTLSIPLKIISLHQIFWHISIRLTGGFTPRPLHFNRQSSHSMIGIWLHVPFLMLTIHVSFRTILRLISIAAIDT